MRSLYLTGALALACVGISPAQAAPSAGQFPVTGRVGGACTVPPAGSITLTTTVPDNGKLDPTLQGKTWTVAGLACNGGSRISVSARALRINVPKASLSSSQSQVINFTATATGWTADAATVTTGETNPLGTTTLYTGAQKVQGAAKAATVSVTVSNFVVVANKASSVKPIDGAYSATIILNLSPSI